MWNKVAAISSALLLSSLATAADPRIEASKANLYVGKSVMACGTLAEINHLPNRHYMNFDRKYPNQSLTALIWNKDYRWFENRYGKIDNYVGSRFCVIGKVAQNQNYLQINVTNPQFLKLMAD
ncbi:hypothetical protein [Psychrobacter phenylpyruvicus]|uniref:Uncharacterized protein n=1 Tax=Psychrobacter phenylpyruvicus TaxID=29432 RepID=A0A379LM83_9GAMM|nr:hypothetical protein [Psychrobacter phenylpyruvicus]SUD90882.1 Uncharacterised protein [Psychrobacter phenylpyruvicus]